VELRGEIFHSWWLTHEQNGSPHAKKSNQSGCTQFCHHPASHGECFAATGGEYACWALDLLSSITYMARMRLVHYFLFSMEATVLTMSTVS
jgi:hypothetical protein